MRTLSKLYDWFIRFLADLHDDPPFIPISIEEVAAIGREELLVRTFEPSHDTRKIFDRDAFDTPFASQMRERMLAFPVAKLSETVSVDRNINTWVDKWEDVATDRLKMSLSRYVVTDTTELTLLIDCDPWRWIKKKLGLTMRKQVIKLHGVVLYPYLTVKLSHNRHHVKWEVISLPTG